MSLKPHALYELLPDYLRRRDAETGYPLRGLVTLIGEQVDAVEADIAQQYANWFIETCADWAVPYIGDLVGYRPVAATGRTRAPAITPRAEIANTLAWRRRKGTLALLEELADSISGWPSRAVEFYALLARTQHVAHVRPERGRRPDLRDSDSLARLGTPFDSLAHNVDIRRQGRFNVPSVGIFAWRLRTYSVTHAPAYCVESEGSQCYSFSILGNDSPLYARAVPETVPTTIAGEANLPVRIRRRALEHRDDHGAPVVHASEALYGAGKSLAIYAPDWPEKGAPQPVPAARIVPADLADWHYRAGRGQLLVDPERGRILFPVRQPPKHGVWVDYRTAFSADIGGGEYHRPLAQPAAFELYQVSRDRIGKDIHKSITAALQVWREVRDHRADRSRAAVIEILYSWVYSDQLVIELSVGDDLKIRAAAR